MSNLDRVEQRVADLLERRAAAVSVRPDLEAVLGGSVSPAAEPPAPPARRVLVGAALALVVLAGGLLFRSLTTSEVGPDRSVAEDPAAVPSASIELVVWLDVGVAPATVSALESWLEDQPGVLSWTYVDQEATYQEFTRYFSDQPEVIDLVGPDMLPTSFLVTTTDPTLATALGYWPGVEEVEIPDGSS